jgi:hypothetical protein
MQGMLYHSTPSFLVSPKSGLSTIALQAVILQSPRTRNLSQPCASWMYQMGTRPGSMHFDFRSLVESTWGVVVVVQFRQLPDELLVNAQTGPRSQVCDGYAAQKSNQTERLASHSKQSSDAAASCRRDVTSCAYFTRSEITDECFEEETRGRLLPCRCKH